MFYQEVIEYGGDPVKAIISGGYCLTPIATDIPVTHLVVAEVLGLFRMIVGEDTVRCHCMLMAYQPNGLNKARFIGEQLIFLDILGTLYDNSNEANASIFQTEVTETAERIIFTISDNGNGLIPSVEEKVLRSVVTTKHAGFACNLFLARKMLQNIDGTITYKGKGLDGKGACFELTFLKEMPIAN